MARFVALVEIVFSVSLLAGLLIRLSAIPLPIDLPVAIATTKTALRRRAGALSSKVGVRILVVAAIGLGSAGARAGPPFATDDPEPVERRHWEFYLANQDELTHQAASGTCPHVEVNYGAVPNLQLHAIVPLGYSRPTGGPTTFGLGDIELGLKLRFVQERANVPMVGIFPQLELPAGSEARGLGTGRLHGFVPVWLQKSRGPWTTCGGGGYGWNPGEGNRDYWFVGWLVQRSVSDRAALGVEIFSITADQVGGRGELRFNVGSVLDLTRHHHVLLSAGHTLAGDAASQAYLAYQLTL
jgi:hypothetical protein